MHPVAQNHRRLKASRQRDLILHLLRGSRSHPSANWIYEQARMEMPNISLGTVYRNLRLLRDEGKIRELCFGSGFSRYDGDLRDHYHVRCIECARVEDVPHISPRASSKEIGMMTGYRILSHRLEFWGICPDCDAGKSTKSGEFTGERAVGMGIEDSESNRHERFPGQGVGLHG